MRAVVRILLITICLSVCYIGGYAQDSVSFTPTIMQVDSTAIKDSIVLANLRKVPVLIDKSKQNTSIDSFIVAYNKDFKEYITLKKKMSLHHATASDVEPLDRKFKAPDQIYILFALFLLLVLVSYFFSRDLSVMAQGFINNRILNQLVRDNNLLNSESFIFMAILIGLTFGYLLQILFGINELLGISGVGTYLLLSLFVMLFFMAKTIVLRLAGALFGIRNMVNNYISIIYVSFGTFTLLLIPLLILYTLGPLVFKHNMIIVFSSILVLSFTYQYLRGAIFISSNFQFSKFYFIIYLCAFEICPLIILYKVLLN